MIELRCPVCKDELKLRDDSRTYQCSNNHSFDLARQGYVNLLLNQHKKSKRPGDSSEMIRARSDFLDAGYYEGIAHSAISLIQEFSETNRPDKELSYCDIACGEGYYTDRFYRSLSAAAQEQVVDTIGFDISTPAIKAASRRSKKIRWVVANASTLPIADQSIDIASCLFCRVEYQEARRILKDDGVLLIVESGVNHLLELRERLYTEIKGNKTGPKTASLPAGFEEIARSDFNQIISVSGDSMLLNLLKMTPHFWRSNEESKSALTKLDSLDLTIDVQIHLFRKCS